VCAGQCCSPPRTSGTEVPPPGDTLPIQYLRGGGTLSDHEQDNIILLLTVVGYNNKKK
jgi:hypothetical protein